MLMEKIHVLNKLDSVVSYSVVGHKLRVNQKKEEEICRPVHEVTPESAKVTSTVHGESMEKREKWLNL